MTYLGKMAQFVTTVIRNIENWTLALPSECMLPPQPWYVMG